MHPLNNPVQIHLDRPQACIPVKREGNKLYLNGNLEIAKAHTIWAKLPEKYTVVTELGTPVKVNGQFIISLETIDPYHLIADIKSPK